jgi:large subunit ribosomal protein L13e
VDPRRQNLSEESLKVNVARLHEYKKRLILFPRRSGQTKTLDASPEEVKKAKKGENVLSHVAGAFAIENLAKVEEVKIKDVKGTPDAYKTLRKLRSDARLVGVREKRAKAKEEEEASKKK